MISAAAAAHAWPRQRPRRRLREAVQAREGAIEAMWRSAAAHLGADMRRLSPDILEVALGAASTRIRDRLTTPLTDRVSYAAARDKAGGRGTVGDAHTAAQLRRVVVDVGRRRFESSRLHSVLPRGESVTIKSASNDTSSSRSRRLPQLTFPAWSSRPWLSGAALGVRLAGRGRGH